MGLADDIIDIIAPTRDWKRNHMRVLCLYNVRACTPHCERARNLAPAGNGEDGT